MFGRDTNYSTVKQAICGLLQASGITSRTEDFFSKAILDLYGLADSEQALSMTSQSFAELYADIVFRIPPYLVGLDHRASKVFLYEFQAKNPYPA